jgi:hypothetical protein
MHWFVGHLIGDYILQNDWMANNKLWKGDNPSSLNVAFFHALVVTVCIYCCGRVAGYEWETWKLFVIWISHGLQDCFRLGTVWMNLYGQFRYFKEKLPEAYVWATIVVDNVFHFALLFVLFYL